MNDVADEAVMAKLAAIGAIQDFAAKATVSMQKQLASRAKSLRPTVTPPKPAPLPKMPASAMLGARVAKPAA